MNIPAATQEPDATGQAPGLSRYRRIEIDLRAQVAGGRWAVGAMLPSRRDLAQEYAVSLVTLDRAIGPLLADGILRADDRRGTFVSELPAQRPRHISVDRTAEKPTLSLGGSANEKFGSIGVITTYTQVVGQELLVLHELEQVLSPWGLPVHVTSLVRGSTPPRSLTETIQAMVREVAALFVVCFDIDKASITAELGRMRLGDIPVVCIVAGELHLPVPHVFYDYQSGGYQAAQHLMERGWQDITVIAPFSATWVSERIAGVCDAVRRHAQPHAVQVLPADRPDWDMFQGPRPLGYRAAKAALAAGWRPDGIICVSDGVAFGVLDAAAEQGLEAGKDFAVLGFDDLPEARDRGLTSLRPPIHGLAREAARLLLDHMRGMDTALQVRLRAHVIPRASTRRREAIRP